MTPMLWIAIILFVITDMVVILLVFRRFRSSTLGPVLMGRGGARLLGSVHDVVGEHLRANYSGDPQHLPIAIAGLVPRVRELLRSHGVEPRPDVVQAMIEASAAKHRVASAKQLREALATIG